VAKSKLARCANGMPIDLVTSDRPGHSHGPVRWGRSHAGRCGASVGARRQAVGVLNWRPGCHVVAFVPITAEGCGAMTTVLTTPTPDTLPSGPTLQIEHCQVSHHMPQRARFLQARGPWFEPKCAHRVLAARGPNGLLGERLLLRGRAKPRAKVLSPCRG
jgi:hypothetical protein